ncbi:bifunctional diguanylate cyclase/phosphodiesterase [Inquilinus sp. Marseille-Q2685]|uniref:putative bifunctional diguanylate cyclase/phosphodiesterase n=1 Tax=Inquilinus sp. Marseille-Q2685 TaxID=2866581 RepID=UPI001CE4030F|nr:EAL domain-containing protein [Inquilinus sp. Marseille-Q2685]
MTGFPASPLIALERDALQALVDGDPIEAILRDVARAVGRLHGPSCPEAGVAFLRLDESGASLSLLAQSGLQEPVLDALGTIRVGPAGPPPGVAVFTNAPAAGPLCRTEDAGEVLAEPLTDDDGRIAGALVLAGLSPDGMPGALRQTVGRLFAMALRRDRRDRDVQDLIYRDPLTGLPNRRCFEERLAETFARGVDAASPVSVLFMDLDEFKKVNDTLGHEVGDLLLAIVGSRLRRALSAEAFVARLGGDEFAAIVTADAGAAAAAAGRIAKALREPAMLRGYRLPIYCSIGIATCPDHESDPALLKRLADMAMYYAKQSATGIASAATPEVRRAMSISAVEFDIPAALQSDQIGLVFQPRVKLVSGQVTGFEALARWNHPTLGVLSPSHFIPWVERRPDLALRYTEWLLRSLADTLIRLPRDALVPISINIPVAVMQSDAVFTGMLDRMTEAGLPLSLLRIEIVERALTRMPAEVEAVVERMVGLGITFELDDFGSGEANLAALSRLPFSAIKIAGEIVQTLATEPRCERLIDGIARFAETFGVSLCAEHVESQAQYDILRRLGVEQGQGYLFGQPVPAGDLAAAVRAVHRGT